MNIKRRVKTIKKNIDKLYEELKVFQESCQHPPETLEIRLGSNTGNYDPSCDYYWKSFKCLICEKQWQEEQ